MNIVNKLKKYGIIEGFRYLCRNYLGTDIHKAHYLRLIIDISALNSNLEGFDLDVKELSLKDFLLGDPNVFNKEKLRIYEDRFKDSSYKAYGIIENGKLVYSTWISLHRVGMTVETRPVFLAANEGYLEDSYCDPKARGRGFHSKMNNFRILKIYEAGKTRVIAIVQHGNTPAFKVQFKSGFEDLGCFHHGTILGIKFNTLRKNKYDNR